MFCDLASVIPVLLHNITPVYRHILPSLVFFFREASVLKTIKKIVPTKVPEEESVTDQTERID